jgi:hypothetical protein
MDGGRTRYEILVATLLNQASLAALRAGPVPTAVPRRQVYRLRIPARRDLPEVLHRLTDHDVQVLEIRQCVEGRPEPPPGRSRTSAPPAETDVPAAADDVPERPTGPSGTDVPAEDGVVVPFPGGRTVPLSRRGPDPAGPVARTPAGTERVVRRERADRPGHLRSVPR